MAKSNITFSQVELMKNNKRSPLSRILLLMLEEEDSENLKLFNDDGDEWIINYCAIYCVSIAHLLICI